MQVSLLRLNTGIRRAVQTQETLERQNATLQAAIAEGDVGRARRSAAAVALKMVDPPAGETRYLTARPATATPRRAGTAHEAAERARVAIMANNGIVPGILAEAGSPAAALAAPLNGQPVHDPGRGHDGHARGHARPGGHAGPGHAGRARRHARPHRDADTDRTPGDDRPRHGRGRGPRGVVSRVQLVERRIGLLFAVFLARRSAIGAIKAAWLGVVKAGALKRAAVTQQEADIEIPARRGAITDVNGIDLAVSEPAVDIAATPYLVDGRDQGRGAARAADRRRRGQAAAQARAPRHRLRLPRSRDPGRQGRPRREAQDRRAGVHPALQARLPARLDRPRSCSAASAPTTRAWAGSSTASTSACAAPTASAGWSRTRWATRSRCATRSRSSPATTSA